MVVILQTVRFVFCFMISILISICTMLSMIFMSKTKAWEFWFKNWGKILIYCYQVKVNISGEEHLKGPAIFIMNHQSIVDVFLLPAIAPNKSTFLAKKELKMIPFVSHAMAAGGCIFIDRKNSHAAFKSIDEGINNLPKNYSLLIFPEGTRSTNFKLQKFKKGTCHIAFKSKLPIVPIGYYGMQSIGGGKSLLTKPGSLQLFVNKPIDTTNWKPETIDSHLLEMHKAVEDSITKAKMITESKKNI